MVDPISNLQEIIEKKYKLKILKISLELGTILKLVKAKRNEITLDELKILGKSIT